MAFSDRLLGPGGPRDDAFEITKGYLFLVQAKGQGLTQNLVSYILEAVSQAIALLKSAKCVSPACFISSYEHSFQPSRGPFLSI